MFKRLTAAAIMVSFSVCAHAQDGKATVEVLLDRLKGKDQDIVSCNATVGGLQLTIEQQGKQMGDMVRRIKELETAAATKK
jgi:hypothetical protein